MRTILPPCKAGAAEPHKTSPADSSCRVATMEAASAQAQCATALGDRCALDPAAPQAAQGHPRKEAWINKCGRESPLQVRQVTKSSGHKVLGNRCTHGGRQKKEVHLLLMLVVVQLCASNTCMQGPPLPASPHAA